MGEGNEDGEGDKVGEEEDDWEGQIFILNIVFVILSLSRMDAHFRVLYI